MKRRELGAETQSPLEMGIHVGAAAWPQQWSWWLLAAALVLTGASRVAERERPLCAPEAGAQCEMRDHTYDEFFYKINGSTLQIDFEEGRYYKINCAVIPLDHVAVPRFARVMLFESVTLNACGPPATSYATALLALNVSMARVKSLRILKLPPGARLTSAAFAGLPDTLLDMELQADVFAGINLATAPGSLAESSLNALALNCVRVDQLPAKLTKLKLIETGIKKMPTEALNVEELTIKEPGLTSMPERYERLTKLTLTAPLTALPATPAQEVYVSGWTEREPAPLRECSRLRQLTLSGVAAERLPARFVAACGALQSLELSMLPALRALPADFLADAISLRMFKISHVNISSLPQNLFMYSPEMETVELININLQSLPKGLFTPMTKLRSLSLYGNALGAGDVAAAVAPLAQLHVLNLARNPLGDLCPDGNSLFSVRQSSVLRRLTALQKLHLSHALIPRVCVDWMRDMQQLRTLDLVGNEIRKLACEDLNVDRAVTPADVDLTGNPLTRVDCKEDNYLATQDSRVRSTLPKVKMDSLLRCDCGAYWLARALNDSGVPVAFEPRCAATSSAVSGESVRSGTPLRQVSAHVLTCPLACADECACSLAPEPLALRAACRARALPLPALLRAAAAAHAPLRSVRAAGLRDLPDRLPSDLEELDLRGCEVEAASAAAAAALVAGGRRVRLAGNPLRCACDNWPLLDALRAARAQVIDYENTTCSDGSSLEERVRELRCGGAWWLALALVGAAAAASAAAAALLARPEARLRVKALLHARGLRARWLVRRLDPPDADRPYDAFVSHADADARFVYEEIATRLEPARRLCLSERDWPAGAWVPTQIEESVRGSRRTVCVLSPRSLAEDAHWARAELRAAHAQALRDATPRLVLLLLDVSEAELRADRDVSAALDAHPHVRWGETFFWEKLEYALPDPRPPPLRPAPPAAA